MEGVPKNIPKNTEKMRSYKAFVTFIDILGYSDFITVFSVEEYADIITKSLSITDGLEQINDVLLKNISKFMSVNLLSDSMIIALDMNVVHVAKEILNKYSKICKGNPERLVKSIITTTYFSILSNVVVEFISRTGFLLRGAVDFGDFQIMDIRNKRDRLMHSKALVRAYELERIVDLPRIALSRVVFDEIMKLSKTGAPPSYVLKDYDGLNMIDLYKGLSGSHWKRAERLLSNIKTQVLSRSSALDDYKRERKYAWFKNFHNARIQELKRYKPELARKDLVFC